jgi:hypothetical protein
VGGPRDVVGAWAVEVLDHHLVLVGRDEGGGQHPAGLGEAERGRVEQVHVHGGLDG